MTDCLRAGRALKADVGAFEAPTAPEGRAGKNGTRVTPVWSRIETTMAQRITSGDLPPGMRLPPAQVLATEFGVNRHTMRQAIAALCAKGLVHVRHGRGTFVCNLALGYVLGTRTRLSASLLANGVAGVHRLVQSDVLTATAMIAGKLDVASGSQLLRITSVAEARGLPICAGEHWFPADRFAGLDQAFERTGSITHALAQYGIADYTRRENLITAQLPDARVARLLQHSTSRPVLCVESVNVDAAGRALEFGRAWFAGDLVQLLVKHAG